MGELPVRSGVAEVGFVKDEALAYDASSHARPLQALLATLCVFLAVYLLYSLRVVKVTSRFATGVMAVTGGLLLLYAVV